MRYMTRIFKCFISGQLPESYVGKENAMTVIGAKTWSRTIFHSAAAARNSARGGMGTNLILKVRNSELTLRYIAAIY